jgi:hypothetical protein
MSFRKVRQLSVYPIAFGHIQDGQTSFFKKYGMLYLTLFGYEES